MWRGCQGRGELESRRNVFFCQAEDGIRDLIVTGVQTCALPIYDLLATAAAVGELLAVEKQADDVAVTARPLALGHLAPVGGNPPPVGRRAVAGRLAAQEVAPAEHGVALAQRDEALGEREHLALRLVVI